MWHVEEEKILHTLPLKDVQQLLLNEGDKRFITVNLTTGNRLKCICMKVG